MHLKMNVPSLPTNEDLSRLCGHSESGSVSIYMALPEERSTVTAYRARLRQLVRAAEAQSPLAADALSKVKAVEEFAQEPNLWLTDARGLAVFASSAGLETFYLDHQVQDLATVSDHYYLKPILEDLPFERQCLVAVVAVDGLDLYHVTRTGAELLHQYELPERMSPSQRIPGVQQRSQPGSGQSRGAVFHGHASDTKDKETAKRLRAMDEWLLDRTRALKHLPLILAGVSYLTSAFRPASKFPNILVETIEGSRLTEQEIAEGASVILEAARHDEFALARERYHALAGGAKVVTQYDKILDAAKDGRVDTVFVAADRNQWMSGSQMGLREDVFDRIGVETHLARGVVFVVPESETPTGEGACAILRY